MSDEKDGFRKPTELLEFAGLSPSDKVLDISTGFGYLAQHIAAKTNVIVDAQNGSEFRELFESFGIQKAIDSLEKDGKIKHNWSSFEDPGRGQEDVYDLITLQNGFHDLYDLPVDRTKFFCSVKAALKPKGRFLLVDHQAGPGRGSQDTKELHRIEECVVREELAAGGFSVVETSDMFALATDDYSKSAWKEPNVETDRFVLLCKKGQDDDTKKTKTTDADADAPKTGLSEDSTGETSAADKEPPLKKAKQT